MAGSWHCAVVGTCLTLVDLRTLARKLSVRTRAGYSADYQLHGFFAKEAERPDKPAKMLNKLLDKRYYTTIHKARGLNTAKELADFWESARKTGDIPGPYWAILSHPAVTQELSERMFADVHMLSHLVGASNRADIRRLQVLEEQSVVLEERLARQQRHHQLRLANRDRQIAELREKSCIGCSQPAETPTPFQPECACATIPALQGELTRLATERAQSSLKIGEQQNRINELVRLVQAMGEENVALEQTLLRERPANNNLCPFDLGGHCLLYVGGRRQVVHRLRSLVEEWNGEFLHHDGGIERSLKELAHAIAKADSVVFPTDCVSHSAANKIKRLCNQTMKPYVPLRTSGVASFIAGLRDGLVT
jgi:hypothetical protein